MGRSTNQVLYIGNLPSTISEQDFANLASPFGKITHLRIAKNFFQKDANLDFGFIKYQDPGSYQKACDQLNNQLYQEKFLIAQIIEELPQV